MHSLFEPTMAEAKVKEISNVGLAHLGDGVFELLCRTYLCLQGDTTVKTLHRDTVSLVNASAQARMVQAILPVLTEEEAGYFRRGKNAHTHASPKSATPQEYALATGLETLLGALYLLGRRERISELFGQMTDAVNAEAGHGI